ncbi:unnamed protein product [Echinostoma caproni]|uniref:Uncharacterized protein n=1 Tax=Echinostoma caproni TaxID=27848 RepID=A0A183A7K4_9TREM|nr:unnamed protein product [Echinostoma caproni]
MKVPRPEALEDGDSRKFLEEFEDVAELAGIRSDRVGGTGCGAKRPGEDGVGRQEGRPDRGFRHPGRPPEGVAKLSDGAVWSYRGPLSDAVDVRTLLDRALPNLINAARLKLLLDRLVEGLPDNLREKARIVKARRAMDLFTLAEAMRQLSQILIKVSHKLAQTGRARTYDLLRQRTPAHHNVQFSQYQYLRSASYGPSNSWVHFRYPLEDTNKSL